MTLNNKLLYALIAMLVAGAGLTIVQMWAPVVSWLTYGKIVATLAILAIVVALVMVLKSDLGESKNLKDNNYLD